jgi:hypothetical protein
MAPPKGTPTTSNVSDDVDFVSPKLEHVDALFPRYHPLLEPVCYVDALYDGMFIIGYHRSITDVVIMLGGTVIFSKTGIQRTTALSSTESKIMTGCDAGKDIKYFWKLFLDLRFPLTGLTPWVRTIRAQSSVEWSHAAQGLAVLRDPGVGAPGRDVFFKICGTASPADALSKPHRCHFDRLMGYYGSPYTVHEVYRSTPDDNSPSG